MTSWTVDAPTSLDLDDVTALRVRLIAGDIAVIATDERPSLIVSDLSGRPLRVGHFGGTLTVSYDDERLTWDRLLDWLMPPTRDSASVTITVPANCPVQLGVVSASAVVCGVNAGASVKGVSGGITLDGVTGDVAAETVSGALEARDIDGAVRFSSVSGDLTLAGGKLSLLEARNISGQVTADVSLASGGAVQVTTVSGDVTLRLPADSDAAIRVGSASGKVRNDFGNVGRGSGHVSANSLSGTVTLLRRTPAGMESTTR
jgi:hypothetical protein